MAQGELRRCGHCGGAGQEPGYVGKKCTVCHGTGWVRV